MKTDSGMGQLTCGYRETGHRSRTMGQHVFHDHNCNKVLTVDSLQPVKHDLLVTRNCNSKIFPAGGNSIVSVENRYGLEVGSVVEVPMADGVPRHGVIRWMGNIPQVKGEPVAGLELVSEIYQAQTE